MTRPWEEVEEQTLTERLFPTEEAFTDHIRLMRYRSQLAVGIAVLFVSASIFVDFFDPLENAQAVWILRAILLSILGASFLASRSAVISLPRLHTLTYVTYAALSFIFALIISFGGQEVLFTSYHVMAVGVLLRPLSGLQAGLTLGIVTTGALGVAVGIETEGGWRLFVPAMIILLATEYIVQRVADMNYKLLVAEGEARERIEEAMRKMNFLSSFDHLTRVMNRRNFEDALDNALMEARSAGQGLAYLEIDLDYFKQINDTYGHQAGDAVLRAASERIASCLRTGDIVGRMGGDEFAAAVKGATTDVAERVATRILERFKETPVRTSWGDIPISCTIGIGCYSGKGALGTDAIMAAADKSLYEAKEAGRGRIGRAIVVSGVEHPPSQEGLVPGVGMPSMEISSIPEHLTASEETRAEPEVEPQRVEASSADPATVEKSEKSEDTPAEIAAPVPPPPHLRGKRG